MKTRYIALMMFSILALPLVALPAAVAKSLTCQGQFHKVVVDFNARTLKIDGTNPVSFVLHRQKNGDYSLEHTTGSSTAIYFYKFSREAGSTMDHYSLYGSPVGQPSDDQMTCH